MITFIIQWFHPEKNVSCSHIDMDLDNIAQQVMKRLKVENPKHPMFSASREQFSSWKYNNSRGGNTIIEFKTEDMNIVPLIVIFQSVARRLGIYCDLVSFLISDFPASEILNLPIGKPTPNYGLLTWKPKWLN
ncbi:hypothetical protein X777_16571 [Ooceraea biroi]|uniref:Uncharacterized protein n=1 Tax=Ooceraea biroi TaxID=2015173 RepID=A0A026VU39_OOCBI|nr:hypothetical protein X777_16571 [Ooceraea biroi]